MVPMVAGDLCGGIRGGELLFAPVPHTTAGVGRRRASVESIALRQTRRVVSAHVDLLDADGVRKPDDAAVAGRVYGSPALPAGAGGGNDCVTDRGDSEPGAALPEPGVGTFVRSHEFFRAARHAEYRVRHR